MTSSRYLIMAGGTGGHIFPALAVANELKKRGADVHWLGTPNSMESDLIPAENITLHTINIKGFRGKKWLAKLAVPFLLCKAVFQAIHIIRAIDASVVIGFGGFVAAPGGIAAKVLGKKLVIHEQNSVAGTTNRLLSTIANKTLTAFPNSLPNSIHIGNPIRSNIADLNKIASIGDVAPLNVLIVGGSLGAKAINDLVPSAIAEVEQQLLDNTMRPNVWHQTGKNKKLSVVEGYQSFAIDARIEEFISDMDAAYAWADVVICRAGALTVSEIAVVAVPAIFIPLPSAIDNHQYFNAKWLVDNNAAFLIEQKQLTKEGLCNTLLELHHHREKLTGMAARLKDLALPHATNDAVDHCEVFNKKNSEGNHHAI